VIGEIDQLIKNRYIGIFKFVNIPEEALQREKKEEIWNVRIEDKYVEI
jgi:hypothetical protein